LDGGLRRFEFPFPGECKTLDARARADLPGQFMRLSGGYTHYELEGSPSGQLVVLVHGFSVPQFIWDQTFPALTAAGYRVLRYDLFGRGWSDRPRLHYDAELFDRQLTDLLTALHVSQPVDLVGLSMGGVVVANFVSRHPQRVRRLALIDPAGIGSPLSGAMRLATLPLVGEVLFSLIGCGRLLADMAAKLFDRRSVEAFSEAYRPQMAYRGFKRALLSTLRHDVMRDALDTYRRIGALSIPVLLLWGTEDHTVPYERHQALLEAMPQAAFRPIEGAGHIPHYEQPGVVNPLLVDFLRSD